jgi:membrane protein YdbS with pleckstrin-like domain
MYADNDNARAGEKKKIVKLIRSCLITSLYLAISICIMEYSNFGEDRPMNPFMIIGIIYIFCLLCIVIFNLIKYRKIRLQKRKDWPICK